MKTLGTLLWLEFRTSVLWIALLGASVVLWHFVFGLVPRIDLEEPIEYVASLFGFTVAANALGLLANGIFMLRAWRGMRSGELQFKLSSGAHPGMVVVAQFCVAFVSIALFSFLVTSLGWWHLERFGFSLSFVDLVSLWLFAQVSFFLPTIAFGFFLTTYVTAFHLRSLAWLALILGFLGFSKLAELSFAFLERFGYMLLSIPLPTFYFEDQVFELPEEFLNPNVLPQEALWLALMLTLLFIYLSGRLLQEVEL